MLGFFSLAAVMGVAANVIRFKYPGVDPEALPYDAVIGAAGMAVMCAVMLAGHALCFRRFLAYRTARHGRRVALGDVLRPEDAKPRLWRKLTLRAYGVTPSERALAGEIARAGGRQPAIAADRHGTRRGAVA